jgi:hypothetical protein
MTSRSIDPGLGAPEALATAEALADEGKKLEAIDVLQRANRLAPDAEVERRLVRLRYDAVAEIDGSGSSLPWPPPVPDALANVDSPPAVAPDELTLDALRAGIFGHGCLLVRRLVPEARVERLVEGIERAWGGFEAGAAGAPSSETTPWFEPFMPVSDFSLGVKRKLGWEAGAVMLADSPRVMFELIETFEEVGLGRLIAAHLGERPVLSMHKCTLRRVQPDLQGADWHQDGAFLGDGIRTVNVWLSLSHCGRDAPGLDIVPRRLDGVVETGTEGANFKWSVSPDVVERTCGQTSVLRPIFEPGDVLLFDELFLHRTAVGPGMTRERCASESWFFAPSTYPGGAQAGFPLVF